MLYYVISKLLCYNHVCNLQAQYMFLTDSSQNYTHKQRCHKNFIKNEFGGMFQLAGWGKTENGIARVVLLYTDLPYIDYRQCMNEVPQAFRRYITTDKFCAGFSNGKLQHISNFYL